jgi:NAD/NADP transhydrogenase beta subunit
MLFGIALPRRHARAANSRRRHPGGDLDSHEAQHAVRELVTELEKRGAQPDVVLVEASNDVVNPATRDDPSSPIHGMPILDVDHARNIIVLDRR